MKEAVTGRELARLGKPVDYGSVRGVFIGDGATGGATLQKAPV
jgi:hypothetical protein